MSSKNGTGKPYSPTLDRIGQSYKREGRIVQWDDASPAVLHNLVVLVNQAGGSVLFGATRDRGAWAITIFHDLLPNKKQTEYCNSVDMFDSWLNGLCEIWGDVAVELAAAEVPKKA